MLPLGNTVQDFMGKVYPRLQAAQTTGLSQYLANHIILSCENKDVEEVNSMMMDRLDGEALELLSVDTIESASFQAEDTEEDQNYKNELKEIIPLEFLHSLKSSSLPPHHLRLKIGCPVILLWNLMPEQGLCNGT